MKIDRSNYETWFIDFLDGNLNDNQAEQLDVFLSENPDLREELGELNEFKLLPVASKFVGKKSLNKSFSDISDNQYDYLCVACMENDLSDEEIKEFSEIKASDAEKEKVFELFRKTRLTPPDITYRNKKKLIKLSPAQKVIRLSLASLSAAATISILILSWVFISNYNEETSGNFSQAIINEGGSLNSDKKELVPLTKMPENNVEVKAVVNKLISSNKLTAIHENADTEGTVVEKNISRQDNIIPETWVQPSANLLVADKHEYHSDLIRLSLTLPAETSDRLDIRKYIAKTFRQKILKEETIDVRPIRGYEIAEAGVTGINKLLGWEMVFEKTSNAAGEVKSVNFSSKMLKIQTPVNKLASAE